MEVQNYVEADAANLVISYECRDFNEQGTKYLNIYKELISRLFISSVIINRLPIIRLFTLIISHIGFLLVGR